MTARSECPICAGATRFLDALDFNKSCEELRGTILPAAGRSVDYVLCDQCGFCFAPELYEWNLDQFETRIYNSEYVRVDPDYVDVRPRGNAQMLDRIFAECRLELRHLDYGGGNGLLSDLMRDAGWQSASYDPFVDRDLDLRDFGKFDLITAFEVFEHVPNPERLVEDLTSFLDTDGVILFSTMLSDGNLEAGKKLVWWYAAPRNGHISLYSRKSLLLLGARHSLNFASFSAGFHSFWRQIPPWAEHLFQAAG